MSAKYTKPFWRNGDFISFAIFSNGGPSGILNHTKFYYSKVLDTDQAAYEICDSWMHGRKLWTERSMN